MIISNRLHFGGELDYVLDPEILIFTSVDEGQLYVKRLSTNSYEVFCGWATRFLMRITECLSNLLLLRDRIRGLC